MALLCKHWTGKMALAPRSQDTSEPHGNLFPLEVCGLLAFCLHSEACLLQFSSWLHVVSQGEVMPCMSKTGSVQKRLQFRGINHEPLSQPHSRKEWRDLVFNIFGIRWKPIPEKHPSHCQWLSFLFRGGYSLQWLPESLVHMQIFINQGGINPLTLTLNVRLN